MRDVLAFAMHRPKCGVRRKSRSERARLRWPLTGRQFDVVYDGSWPVTAGRRFSRSRLTLIDPTQLATIARSAINRLVTSEQRLRRCPPAAC
jgi:hypothetical protein